MEKGSVPAILFVATPLIFVYNNVTLYRTDALGSETNESTLKFNDHEQETKRMFSANAANVLVRVPVYQQSRFSTHAWRLDS